MSFGLVIYELIMLKLPFKPINQHDATKKGKAFYEMVLKEEIPVLFSETPEILKTLLSM